MDTKSKLAELAMISEVVSSLSEPRPGYSRPPRPLCARVAKGKKCKYHGGCDGSRRPCKWYLQSKERRW